MAAPIFPRAIALEARMAIAQLRATFQKALAKGVNIDLGTDARSIRMAATPNSSTKWWTSA
jgi:hypothetical protein